ncbi:DUF4350 domain-containing protein [Thermosynechococcaceae cyanobacterium Okahandja]
MKTPSRWRWLLLLIAVGVLVVVGVLLMALAPSQRAGSSFDTSPWGSRQFYEYLQQQGRRVERWQRDYPNLKGQGQVLVQISGRPLGLSADLVQWLEAGNTLVRFYWHGEPTAAPFSQRLPTPQGSVLVETRRRLQRRDLDTGDRPLLADDYGIIAYLRPIAGGGQQLHSVYPWLVANAYGNDPPLANFAAVAAFLEALPPTTTIYFDEWLHGYRQRTPDDVVTRPEYRSVLDYLSRTQWLGIGLQLGLILLILLWQQSQRFGPPLQERPPTPSNSATYIAALAAVLQRAQQRAFVQQQLQSYLRHQLAAKLGLSADRGNPHHLPDDASLIQAWQALTGHSPSQLQTVLQAHPTQSDRQLLQWLQAAASVLEPLDRGPSPD